MEAVTVKQEQLKQGERQNFLFLSRQAVDRIVGWMMSLLMVAASLLLVWIALVLLVRAWPIFGSRPLAEVLFSTVWRPMHGAFGYWPFIMGTLWVTSVSMVVAIPICLLAAIYLAEYASPRLYAIVKPLIDVSAGIPSVIYGIWGVLLVVPLVQTIINSDIGRRLSVFPIFKTENPTGYGILAGGLVLAVMVFPIVISVAEEVIRSVPQGLREASWALGATRWQTIKRVVLRRAAPGVIAATVLGFSRAFGETMAVMMVVGNMPQVPQSVFDAAYPLTALIANNYGEMMSIPLYDSALLGAAFVLLLLVVGFNLVARLVLMRLTRRRV